MSTTNATYDQIPHIVLNHPEITGEHIFIFIRLYKILKEFPCWTKPNSDLISSTRIPERTLSRRLNELESWGFIERRGISNNRKIYLGAAFKCGQTYNSTAKSSSKKLNSSAIVAMVPAKSSISPGHGGIYNKNLSNNLKKSEDFFSNSDLAAFTEFRSDLRIRGQACNINIGEWFSVGCPSAKEYLLQNSQI